jgi:glycosyltransferase involved in cell wall biosynthesis
MIFNFLSDGSEGSFPQHVEERVSRIVFLGKEVADRWQLQDPSKKVVIELGLDTEHFSGYRGESGVVLTVGNLLPDRWEKGYMPYRTLCRLMPLTLVGDGNQGLPGAIGSISYEALLDRYRNSSVYFNPGCVIGISVAEAMAVGMPVVTMRPINLCDLIQDGVNGFVVDTVDGAAAKVRLLLGNPTLRQTISLAARETAQRRFGLEVFRREWNRLFSSVLREQE